MISLLTLILAVALPLFLLLVEKILPYPYLIEELAKLILTWLIFKGSFPKKWLVLFLAGLLFTLSESLFYLGMAFAGGYTFLFTKKLFFTLLFHLLTLFLFYISLSREKKLLWVSLPVAVLLHFWFNQIF